VAFLCATSAPAQELLPVTGVVSDSSGLPIIGARVSIGGKGPIMTDDSGEFRFTGVSPGIVEVDARRLGFVPVHEQIRVSAGESANPVLLVMVPLPRMLSPVVVQASNRDLGGRLAGYYHRMQRKAGGYFISRAEIDRKSFQTLSQLIATTPGISAFTLRSGGGTVRMRGSGCRPMVWLDGVPMPAGEVDLDAFSPTTLQGIELYPGSTMAPADFVVNDRLSACGTILLWSRGRDTDPPVRNPVSRVDIVALIDSLQVFSADQVQKPAEIVGREPLKVIYPPELYAANIGGSVLVEFVVDAIGRIEADTYSVVSSSNPLFTQAVTRALESAKYTPAVRSDKPVRQAVQQSFSFVPGSMSAHKSK
jgi:TonB family protein